MRNRITAFLLAIFFVISFPACREDTPDTTIDQLVANQLQTIETFLAENDLNATKDDRGFYYRSLTENPDGAAPQAGDAVNFFYTVSTLDGQLIDEKKEGADEPAKYAFANKFTKVPVALDVMISLMKEGESYEFFLPSVAAYQDFNKPGLIPENAIIRAQVKLAEVLSPAEEKLLEDQKIEAYIAQEGLANADSLAAGVYYIKTEAGEGEEVTDGKIVSVRYKGSLLDGTVFDENTGANAAPLEFTIGAGSVIEGFDIGLRQMQQGEKGTILIPSHAAYGGGTLVIPYSIMDDLLDGDFLPARYATFRDITPFSILRFDVEVESVK